MALIIDPDYLSQGNTNATYDETTTTRFKVVGATPLEADITITSGPQYNLYDYLEVRTSNNLIANNIGLFQVKTVTDATNYRVKKIAGSVGSLSNTNVGGDVTVKLFGANSIAGNNKPGVALSNLARGKSVYFDTYAKKIWLLGGAVSTNLSDDGVTMQALYSFTKEEWKNDPDLIKFDFPFTAITPEQFEIGSGTASGWQLFANTVTTTAEWDGIDTNGRKTEELIRTGGWSEFDTDGTTLLRQYAGIISLGTFDASTDLAYYQQGSDPTDTTAAEDFVFTGPVNEGVLTYRYYSANDDYGLITYPHSNTITRTVGSWITEGYQVGGQIRVVTSDVQQPIGTYEIETLTATDLEVTTDPFNANATNDKVFTSAWDNRNALSVFLRANSTVAISKSYDKGTLTDIGVSTLSNQVYRFPLTNASDVVIDTDAPSNIDLLPYNYANNILIQYFSTPFYAQVTQDVLEPFGIVINNSSYSGVDGATGDGTGIFTSAASKFPQTVRSGTLFVTSGAANTYTTQTAGYTVVSRDSDTQLTVSPNFPGGGGTSGVSFYIQKSASNNNATTIQKIYTSVQHQLRQTFDINAANNQTGTATDLTEAVVGRTADELLTFVGTDAVTTGSALAGIPFNPSGGGSGVFIANYLTADTNKITINGNTNSGLNFPFVGTITLNFNDNLTADQIEGGGTDYSQYWLFYDYAHRRGPAAFDLQNASASSADIVLSGQFTQAGGTTQLTQNDYLRISGFTNSVNNGVFRLVQRVDNDTIRVVKVTGETLINETGTSVTIDEGAIDTPSAIIVQDKDGNDISGNVDASQKTPGYAYTTNQQGPKPANVSRPAILRAIGLETGQFVESASLAIPEGDVTYTVTAGLERNYSND